MVRQLWLLALSVHRAPLPAPLRRADEGDAAVQAWTTVGGGMSKLEKKKARSKSSRSRRQTPTEAAVKTATRTLARDITRYVLRGILGGLKRR